MGLTPNMLAYRYARCGGASTKVDVYAFGVVIYESISAKEAVVRADSSGSEPRGLVCLFDEVLNQPDPKDLWKLVDPGLGDNYPLDSVRKMAQLAKACTHENKELRPSMQSIVVALMTLSSSTEDWDVGSLYENQALSPSTADWDVGSFCERESQSSSVNLMSGSQNLQVHCCV
ncbi:lysM domain receptor-like kinase 3 isoform X2 [Prunus persica]|uniref:lysM domain receptor-like kinase 3 isoform X2 n=1 Tax=Prunus persica TaxID=3760 RepID=UPI0009AB8847|nr:lysM domain receptor-like kinase 3 isoform X2 [Prunus persica]